MSDLPREPLHQPPSPESLRQWPPRTPTCAQVRGLLRDCADGDLEPHAQRLVEEHVHRCRECGIALSQAEHEVLRLRRAYAVGEPWQELCTEPRPGFARRVVERLILDETSLTSRDRLMVAGLSLARDGAGVEDAGGQLLGAGPSGLATQAGAASSMVRPWRWAAVLYAAAMCGVLLAVGIAYELFMADARPVAQARLVITAAADTFGDDGSRLLRGDGLGNAQSLWVGKGGAARADWHDASAKRQPAATLELTNRGEVRVENGSTVLVQGSMLVESRRPLAIPIADGSRIDIGVGEYLISVDDLRGDRSSNLLAAAPGDLRVSVEVRRGDGAQVVRPTLGATLIDVGQLGVYRGGSAVDVVPAGSGLGEYLAGGARRREPVETPQPIQALLSGVVTDRAGVGVGGADVLVSFGSEGQTRMLATGTASAGSFFVETGVVGSAQSCSAPFAIVQALAPAHRVDLAFSIPDVQRLIHRDGHARLAEPVVLDAAVPVSGGVFDEDGGALAGVRVVPCVVDEVFACTLVWAAGQVQTGVLGDFAVRRLPGVLPRHQRLALLLFHEDYESALVALPDHGTAQLGGGGLRVVLRPLRTVRLTALPANNSLTVFEDFESLPPGLAAVRRPVATDPQGEAVLRVGRGRLWLRNTSPTQPMLRELTLVGESGLVYRPQQGAPRPFDVAFQALQPLLGSELWVASSCRFQRFRASATQSTTGTILSLSDAGTGRSASGAQVFALRPTPARSVGSPRFLGLAPASGTLCLDLESGETGVVVIGVDGSLAATMVSQSGDAIDLQLLACGRIQLDTGLRSGDGSLVALYCERLDAPLRGMQSSFVRFTGPMQAWEVGDVPAGRYLVTVSGQSIQVEVPSGGQVRLR